MHFTFFVSVTENVTQLAKNCPFRDDPVLALRKDQNVESNGQAQTTNKVDYHRDGQKEQREAAKSIVAKENYRHLWDSNPRGETPIGLAGRRLNRSAKVSLRGVILSMHLKSSQNCGSTQSMEALDQ